MKKISALYMLVTLVTMTLFPNVTYADTVENSISSKYICMDSFEMLQEYSDEELNYTDAIVVDTDTYNEIEIERIKELIDNGICLIIPNGEISEISKEFDVYIELEDNPLKSTIQMGCFVKSNGTEYEVGAIEYGLLTGDDEEPFTPDDEVEALQELAVMEPIDIDSILCDLEISDNKNYLDTLDEKTVALLQNTSTTLGSAFAENDKFVYFYKKGSVNGTGTEYEYSGSSSKSGYSKLGSVNMTIYAIKVGTISSKTYDLAYGIAVVSGLNEKFVYQFNVGMEVNDNNSNNNIIDYADPEETNSGTYTATIGGTIDSNGNITASGSKTYTFDSNKLSDIQTEAGEKLYKYWKCEAYFDGSYANKSWTVRPSIVISNKKGTTTTTKASIYVDYLKLSGGLRTYTLKDKISCSISFKNHKEVK